MAFGHLDSGTMQVFSISHPFQSVGGGSLRVWQDCVYHQTFTEQPRFVSYPTLPNTLLLRSVARQVSAHERTGGQVSQRRSQHRSIENMVPKGRLLVLDDLMAEGGNDKRVLDRFTKHSDHQNVTVLYLCQDMFPPGKYAKSISRNAHYVVAFKNPRDQLGMRNLLLQAFPTQWQDLQDTFQRLTERPFGYMVLDLHPGSSDDQRILSHLLKDEGCMRCHKFIETL